MQRVQDDFFEQTYFHPAMAWADEHDLTLGLSARVIYDSYIHSGSILRIIRSKFPEKVPSKGGAERAWVTAYVKARHRFLANHSTLEVRSTVYRTRCFSREIDHGNRDLSQLPIDAHGVKVSAALRSRPDSRSRLCVELLGQRAADPLQYRARIRLVVA
ncbi:MAG TPA: chitosanase [Thermoanaerobaculia bacterium]|nr:chitosanase [Thermoanaerobaculia bacterium]